MGVSQVEDWAKRFGVALVSKQKTIGVRFVKGWLKGKLGTMDKPKITVEQLAYAVDRNIDLWDTAPRDLKQQGYTYAKNREVFNSYRELMTPEALIQLIAVDRPDLASYLLNTPRANQWFSGMVDKIRLRLMEKTMSEGT